MPDFPKGYHLPASAVARLQVPLIMRSEILDGSCCDVCAQLDGFTASADDPVWASEMGMPAHCNCRYKLVTLFNVRDPENWVTPTEEIPALTSIMGATLTKEMVDSMKIPVTGNDRLKLRQIRLEDIQDMLEPADLILRIFEDYL